MADRSNEQWLHELRASGDAQEAALQDLKERLQRGIYYYLSRERSDLSGLSSHELEQMSADMAQDATLRVLDNLDSFRGDSMFTTWATRIAVRVAISDLRRARYKDFSLDHIMGESDFLPANANPVLGEKPQQPERVAERDDVMVKVRAALKDVLTDRQYRALFAVAVQNIPLDVVADEMHTNRNALYKLIHDARRKLRAHFEEQGLNMDYLLNLFQE
ncbi:MAG: sigma-70 family RNA polymerase sigma factor [Pleurocapsa minor GSE-CHR-MK-17-07R]|jgi:RNA polymerase sigma-70 factor (ECF subfamily)|nr:sigma-70 family RNA polymerase sigma factor [Pleurocapsa minor GSE-CHR-MK 17-07R]